MMSDDHADPDYCGEGHTFKGTQLGRSLRHIPVHLLGLKTENEEQTTGAFKNMNTLRLQKTAN